MMGDENACPVVLIETGPTSLRGFHLYELDVSNRYERPLDGDGPFPVFISRFCEFEGVNSLAYAILVFIYSGFSDNLPINIDCGIGGIRFDKEDTTDPSGGYRKRLAVRGQS